MSLTDVFARRRAELGQPLDGSIDRAALETSLADTVRLGVEHWPQLAVDPAQFVAHVATHVGEAPPLQAIATVRAPELYLAFACHDGDATAMTALEQAFGAHLQAAYRGLVGTELSSAEFRQLVRDRLFVADAQGRTKIGTYSGQGSLAAWLRVTAKRVGLNAVRGAKLPVDRDIGDDLFELPATLGDPELDLLKETYRAQFRDAFLEAVRALPARSRRLLRQSVTGGLTVRQIGRMYKVHHATAARWIADARQALIDGTRRQLQARLDVSARALQSIMGLIASQLDVSVARVLGPDDEL